MMTRNIFWQDDIEGTPPLMPMSRSDSGSSNHSPSSSQQSSGGGTGFNAVRFTLRRTVSLDKKGFQPWIHAQLDPITKDKWTNVPSSGWKLKSGNYTENIKQHLSSIGYFVIFKKKLNLLLRSHFSFQILMQFKIENKKKRL